MHDTCEIHERWRELFRCDNLLEARAVATSVAAMEFDVRLDTPRMTELDEGDVNEGDAPANLRGPFVVEVPEAHWPQLIDVLAEIIAEQREFDDWVELRKQYRSARFFIVLGATGIVHGLVVWQLIDS